MKLKLKNCPNPETERVLRHAFKATTEALWIDNYAAEVICELAPAEFKLINDGYFSKIDATLGQTEDRMVGNVARMKLFAFNSHQLAETFIHELTHVAQMLRGELSRVNGVSVWKGQKYRDPQTHEEYQNLPWEREADVMAKRIMRRLK